MAWEIEYTHEFSDWWDELRLPEQRSISAGIDLLELRGPGLGFPYTSGIRGSRHTNMRELRVQSRGRPFRIFYAFDPRRTAIILLGGDKTGDDRFYTRFVPLADQLYDDHLAELRREGLLQ